MRTYRVVIDGNPEGYRRLEVEAEGELDLASLETVDLAGEPLVKIGEWLVSRDRIVAIVPEDAPERQRALHGGSA